MGPSLRRDICRYCHGPSSAAYLFLLIILPRISYAQLTSATPTTLATSTIFPSNTPQSFPIRPAQTSPSADADTADDPSSHVFNYYFVIIALFVIVVFAVIFFVSRRRKQKATLLRNNGQSALARDVQSFAEFRQRFGPRRAGAGLMGMTRGPVNGGVYRERQEGLDERGEAPPAYVEGDKPPSLRSVDITYSGSTAYGSNADRSSGEDHRLSVPNPASGEYIPPTTGSVEGTSGVREHQVLGGLETPAPVAGATVSGQDVELSSLTRTTTTDRPPLGPPTYSETVMNETPELSRPANAITAHGRFSSTRRLMSESRTSSEL
ncbi:hypothetical protein CJF31_00005520 [Rutstroemia sp. NJR-2017a BVV2]|nr:hypothetical protein CJF31_00005520 [Rutstroemia sp. NJR-2017a BVV2]